MTIYLDHVAKGILHEGLSPHSDHWDEISESSRNYWRNRAKAALNAAGVSFVEVDPKVENAAKEARGAYIDLRPPLQHTNGWGYANESDKETWRRVAKAVIASVK